MSTFPSWFIWYPRVESLPTGVDHNLSELRLFVSVQCTPPFIVTLALKGVWSQTFDCNENEFRWDRFSTTPIYINYIKVESSTNSFILTTSLNTGLSLTGGEY